MQVVVPTASPAKSDTIRFLAAPPPLDSAACRAATQEDSAQDSSLCNLDSCVGGGRQGGFDGMCVCVCVWQGAACLHAGVDELT